MINENFIRSLKVVEHRFAMGPAMVIIVLYSIEPYSHIYNYTASDWISGNALNNLLKQERDP